MWLDTLIALKKSSKKTLKQIADESGVPLGTLNKLFAGQTKDPKLDTVRSVVHTLGYTLDDLDDSPIKRQIAPPISDEAMKLAQDYDGLDGHGQRVVRLVADEEKARCTEQAKVADQREQSAIDEKLIRFSVPGYRLPLSAGTGQEAGQEYPENYTLVKEPPRGTSFIARVSGDSMEPTYHDGDLVFVHAAEEIPPGKIGAFHMDGQQWIKELGDGVLISHNPAYAPRPMTEDIRCQGLVLGVCDESYFE